MKTSAVSSLAHWYPVASELDVPLAKTVILALTPEELRDFAHCRLDLTRVMSFFTTEVLAKLKLPVFVKTDYFSAYYDWEQTCYVESVEAAKDCLENLLIASRIYRGRGLPLTALCFREYIPMVELMMVNGVKTVPTVRCFIGADGRVDCLHWYWETLVLKGLTHQGDSAVVDVLKDTLDKAKQLAKSEIGAVKVSCTKLGPLYDAGIRAVDFCRAVDGRWVLTDAAGADEFWHPVCAAVKTV